MISGGCIGRGGGDRTSSSAGVVYAVLPPVWNPSATSGPGAECILHFQTACRPELITRAGVLSVHFLLGTKLFQFVTLPADAVRSTVTCEWEFVRARLEAYWRHTGGCSLTIISRPACMHA